MPEHFAAGLKPHSVSEKYYFARGPQLVNRVVDIGPTFEIKLACLRACRTMVTHMIKDLNASLIERKLRLPALADSDRAAIEEYTKVAVETSDRHTCRSSKPRLPPNTILRTLLTGRIVDQGFFLEISNSQWYFHEM